MSRYLLTLFFALLSFVKLLAEPAVSFDGKTNPPQAIATEAPVGATLTLHLVDVESSEPGEAMLADLNTGVEDLGQWTLVPRFGFVAGSTYRARLSLQGKILAQADWTQPMVESRAPEVVSIDPTASELPANLLKFHIAFSEPMRRSRGIFDLFHIEDDYSGKRVEAPWRQLELWSEDHRRLTLWIHPGRVKQGVNLRTSMGPVLLPDRSYTLVIEAGLLSLAGVPTAEPTRKKFFTLAEDHERPSAKNWQLTLPKVGSKDALFVESPEPLDSMLAIRYLRVSDAIGDDVELIVSTQDVADGKENHGRKFGLIPKQPWRNEPYVIHAGEFLEDLAGNTPTRVFDTDLENPVADATEGDLQREFRPLPAE